MMQEIIRLHKSNIATMESSRRRLREIGKATHELDVAIKETKELLERVNEEQATSQTESHS